MPLDQRIRGALGRAAATVEPDVEGRLASTLEHADGPGRRVSIGLFAAAATIALVVVVVGPRFIPRPDVGGVGDQPDGPVASPTEPASSSFDAVAGRWAVTLDDADPGVAGLGLAGTWSMTLGADGTIDLVPPAAFTGSHAVGHTFSLDGDTFRTDLYYNDYCDSVGAYAWARSGDGLTFTTASDTCAIRTALLGTRAWSGAP